MENIAFIDIFTTQNDLYGQNNCPIQFGLEIFRHEEVFDEEKFLENKCQRQKVINIVPDERILASGTLISGFRDSDVSLPSNGFKPLRESLEAIYRILSTLRDKKVFVCGFNHLAYDLEILNRNFKRVLDKDPMVFDKERILDVYKMMENTVEVTEIGSYSMDSCFEYLYHDLNALKEIRSVKSTLTDIYLTKKMLWKIMTRGETFSELYQRTQPGNDMEIFNFGKYKGAKISEIIKIDQQYVSWVLNNKSFKETSPFIIESINRVLSKSSSAV